MQGHFIWGIFSKRRNTVLPLLGKDSAPKTRTPYQEPLSPDPSVRLPAQLRGTATPRAAEGASPVGSPGDERPHSHAHRDGTLVRHAGPGQEQGGRDGTRAAGPGQGTEPGAPAPTAAEVWTAPAAAPDWPRGTHAVRGAHHSHELAGRCGGAAEGSAARSRRVSCPRALLRHLPPPTTSAGSSRMAAAEEPNAVLTAAAAGLLNSPKHGDCSACLGSCSKAGSPFD